MKHKFCAGEVTAVESMDQEIVTFQCLKCGKTWRVSDDLTDVENDVNEKENKKLNSSYQFAKFHKNPFLNALLNYRLVCLAKMASILPADQDVVGIDIGCQTGYFLEHFADRLSGTFIGIDVSRIDLSRAKIFAKLRANPNSVVEFILADINHLPFKEESIQLVLCASVLEHVKNINESLKQINDVLGQGGYLIAGYPIETDLFISLIKLVRPDWMGIRDPDIAGKTEFENSPDTHKQSFNAIREALKEQFLVVERKKSFFNILPDLLSWYECAVMKKDNVNSNPTD